MEQVDWSKAKSILIFAFLVANIILFGFLYSSGRDMEPTLKKEFIEEAIKLLENKEIYLNTEIPKEAASLNTLMVEYETMDISDVNEKFFENKGLVDLSDDKISKIRNENESVSIENNKILKYKNNIKKNKYNVITKELAEEVALKFLQEREYKTSDLALSHIREEEGIYYLSFSKIYNERYLERAYIDLAVDSRGVIEMESLLLKTESEGEILIEISTAPKAILSLLSMEEVYGKTISEIDLCYYFDPEDHEHLPNPQEAKKGKTIPAWRVLFEDGSKFIIDNY